MNTSQLLHVALGMVVLAAIPQLGDEHFVTRQATSARIERLLPAGIEFVADAAEHDEDAEVRRRCQQLLTGWHGKRLMGLLPDGCREFPWIDSWPGYRQHHHHLDRARAYMGYGSWENGYPEYREATRLLVEEMLHDGWADADVRTLLREMVEGDKLQIQRHEAAGRLTPIPNQPIATSNPPM